MKRRSIKTAVIRAFIAVALLMLAALMVVWQKDYDWISENGGSKVVDGIANHSQGRLVEFFRAPMTLGETLREVIVYEGYDRADDLSSMQQTMTNVFTTVHSSLPQLSVVSYGDAEKRFVGVRKNDDASFSVMLKDARTAPYLRIYDGLAISDTVVAEFEGYDPTIRPWYTAATYTDKWQWSQVYVNMDEQMAPTISAVMPIFEAREVNGVVCVDIKLSGIHDYLKNDTSIGEGVVYILNEKHQIIAQSSEGETATIDEASGEGNLVYALDSENTLISASMSYFNSTDVAYHEAAQIDIEGQTYFVRIKNIEALENLNWKVAVVIPEEVILGDIRARQWVVGLFILVLLLVGASIGSYMLSRILKPILDSTQMAAAISKGRWGAEIHVDKVRYKETADLIEAFNRMSVHLNQSFKEISKKEVQYRLLVENVDDMIYAFKLDGTLMSVNKSFEERFHVRRKTVVGQNFFELVSDNAQLLPLKQNLKALQTTPEKQTFIFEYRHADGKRGVYNVTWVPKFDRKGVVEFVLGTNVNVTKLVETQEMLNSLYSSEKMRLEHLINEKNEALSKALVELIEKEKMASLGSLVSGVSHEINTPLGVSVSAASFMESTNKRIVKRYEEGTLTKSDFLAYVEKMEETAVILNTNLKRASDLIKSFKAIAIDQHMDDLTEVHVKTYIETILLSLKHAYKGGGHRFVIDCDDALTIVTRPGAISQILTNLIMNSIIHGFGEARGGEVIIRVTKNGTCVTMTYIDDGKGIPKDILHKIYDPFFTTNRGNGGSGLGLNVVYNIVKRQLDGSIEVQSTEGEGTRFEIVFESEEA